MLALTNPYPALIGILLLIAAYMFAAIKFPALRFIFRLKRGAAWVARVDDDANRRLGESLGLVLCPLIGVGALVASGWLLFQWKQDAAAAENRRAAALEDIRRFQEDAKAVYTGWEIQKVNYGGFEQYGMNADGRHKLNQFVRRMGDEFTSECVPADARQTQLKWDPDSWRVELKPKGKDSGLAVLIMVPESKKMILGINLNSNKPPFRGYQLVVPGSVAEAWEELLNTEKVDLQALEKEKRRVKAEEEKRLSYYKERVFEGPPAYQIYEAVMGASDERREAKKAEFLGMAVDWEVQLNLVEQENGVLLVRADQSRPNPGASWSIFFETSRDTLPDIDRLPRFQFARIKGVIESLDKGIRIKISSLERIQP